MYEIWKLAIWALEMCRTGLFTASLCCGWYVYKSHVYFNWTNVYILHHNVMFGNNYSHCICIGKTSFTNVIPNFRALRP